MTSAVQRLIDRAVGRVERCYSLADRVAVQFSGGKDSGACVECALIAARRLGRRLIVRYYDEEYLLPETEAYLVRMRDRALADGDWDFEWLCIERTEAQGWDGQPWRVWDARCPDAWIRDRPPWSVRGSVRGGEGSMEDCVIQDARSHQPRVTCSIIGRRGQESAARQMLASSRGWYLPPNAERPYARAHPVDDWPTEGLWAAYREMGWDWNRHYLWLWRAGAKKAQLRVGMPTGLQAVEMPPLIRKVAPDLYRRSVLRLPAYELTERYGASAVMGWGAALDGRPELTLEAIEKAVGALDDGQIRKTTKAALRNYVRRCLSRRARIDPMVLYRIALRGDTAQRRLSLSMGRDVHKSATDAGHFHGRSESAIVGRIKAAAKAQRLADGKCG